MKYTYIKTILIMSLCIPCNIYTSLQEKLTKLSFYTCCTSLLIAFSLKQELKNRKVVHETSCEVCPQNLNNYRTGCWQYSAFTPLLETTKNSFFYASAITGATFVTLKGAQLLRDHNSDT